MDVVLIASFCRENLYWILPLLSSLVLLNLLFISWTLGKIMASKHYVVRQLVIPRRSTEVVKDAIIKSLKFPMVSSDQGSEKHICFNGLHYLMDMTETKEKVTIEIRQTKTLLIWKGILGTYHDSWTFEVLRKQDNDTILYVTKKGNYSSPLTRFWVSLFIGFEKDVHLNMSCIAQRFDVDPTHIVHPDFNLKEE